MGGRDGARGYLYQAIISVIDSISDQKWLNVTLEPETNDEKIDILWEYPGGFKKVTQVKSTQGRIGKNKILDVLRLMINDVPEAKKYELVIVGDVTNDGALLKQQFDQRDFATDDPIFIDFKNYINKIEIRVERSSIESFEAKIYKQVDKFLFTNNPIINPEIKEIFVKSLIYQFFFYSTEGKTLSRKDLNELLALNTCSDWRDLEIDSIVRYLVYLLDRFFDAELEEKLKIIKMFAILEEVIYEQQSILSEDKLSNINIFKMALQFKNNHLFLCQNILETSREQVETFIKGMEQDSIYIYSVEVIILIISLLLALLSPSYREKLEFGEQPLMKDIKDIEETTIKELENNYSKREFLVMAIEKINIFSYFDGSWKNTPVAPVW